MDRGDEINQAFPSQGDRTEGSQSDNAATEGVTMLRWQREEGGRMSRRETSGGRRTRTPTPTPHRVSAMPNATVGIRRDSDSEEDGTRQNQTQGQQQQPPWPPEATIPPVSSLTANDLQNQHSMSW